MMPKDNNSHMLRLMYSCTQSNIYLPLPVMSDYTFLPARFTSHHHIHPVYHLVFILGGQGSLSLTDYNIPLRPRDVVLINPMEKHIFTTDDNHLNYFAVNFYLIPVDKNNAGEILDAYIGNPKQVEIYAETKKLEDIISIRAEKSRVIYNADYWDALEQDITGFRNSIDGFVNAFRVRSQDKSVHIRYINRTFDFLTRVVSRYLSGSKLNDINETRDDILAQKITNYLENSLDKSLNLKHIAKKLGYNPAYLSGHFSSKTNLTISEYFSRMKISKACEYLKHTDKSITDISTIFGYSSPQYFSRVFKNAKKVTPREYRKNIEMY